MGTTRRNAEDMKAISLSKSMKLKNRLAGRLSRVQNTIRTYNSVVESSKDQVDVIQLDVQRSELVSALIDLKTAISESSRGIQKLIYEITEKKSEIDHLNSLNTREGVEQNLYSQTPQTTTYYAYITRNDVDQRVKKLETEIDELQDKIDAYNAVPDRVKIPSRILELAS
jgi:chromosome segregation ATPase